MREGISLWAGSVFLLMHSAYVSLKLTYLTNQKTSKKKIIKFPSVCHVYNSFIQMLQRPLIDPTLVIYSRRPNISCCEKQQPIISFKRKSKGKNVIWPIKILIDFVKTFAIKLVCLSLISYNIS